jgi:hypothetical protein
VLGELGQGQALEAAVQDAGDGLGAVHWSGSDLVDERGDVVSGELGGSEPLVESLAGGFALVPASFGLGEPGGDLRSKWVKLLVGRVGLEPTTGGL